MNGLVTARPARGGSTNVTWAMSGPQPNFAKVISIFFSMDSLPGKEFEAGLANLKSVAEAQTGVRAPESPIASNQRRALCN